MGQPSQESYWEEGGICPVRRISTFPCRGCSPPIVVDKQPLGQPEMT